MKNFQIFNLFVAILSVCVLTLSSCENEFDVKESASDIVVTLSVDEIFQEKAFVRVRHNGTGDNVWFCFLTDDLKSDATALLNQELRSTLDFYGEIMGNQGVNKSILMPNLNARTEYRAIAAGITASGKICTNVAEVVFCTKRDPSDFFINENWSIDYKERVTSQEDSNVESERFEIKCSDSLTFYPFIVLKDEFENMYNNDVRTCFESYVAFRNSENIRWSKAIMQADTLHTIDRLRSNKYIAFMMGIDAEGELTGYYSKKDVEIKQELQTVEYAKWLGEWTVTGKAWDNTDKSYDINIVADENNLYYKMYGWEGDNTSGYYTTVPDDLPIPLYFEKSTGNAYVVSADLGVSGEDALFFVYGNAKINDSITPINIENLRVARFTYVNDMPYLTPETYSVYDDYGIHHNGNYVSFSYCYTLRGFEYVGFAPFTPDSKVPDLAGVKIEKK